MGDSIKAISEDINEYINLCEKHGEEPEKDEVSINPYGQHADWLKKKNKGNTKLTFSEWLNKMKGIK